MSPERPTPPGAVRRFYFALALFMAWVIGLGVLAFTSSERPRDAAPPTVPARP